MAKQTNAARARAKAIAGQLFTLRNVASPAALDLADDLQDLANEFEVLAISLRYEIKAEADARFRA